MEVLDFGFAERSLSREQLCIVMSHDFGMSDIEFFFFWYCFHLFLVLVSNLA